MDPTFVATIASVAGGDRIDVAAFCREREISRQTFYKYLRRFRAEGADGFTRRSTAPLHHPTRFDGVVHEAVLRARKELADAGLDNGPISIRWRLDEMGFEPLPSRVSIHRILTERGQIVAEPRKRPKPRRRFEYSDPGGLWQIDGMEFYLATGEKVCILQILDDHSRLDVGTCSATSENGDEAWRALQQAFAGYGLPVRVLFDNGTAFSSRHRGGTSALERRLADAGVQTITSSIYHPQTCGKNERSHQTLQKWLRARATPETLEELDELLEKYRTVYNSRRHQSLDGRTPQQVYDATPVVTATPEPKHRPGTTTRKVSPTGIVQFDGHAITIGRKWANTTATVHWRGDDVTVIIGDVVARELTLNRHVRSQPLPTTCQRSSETDVSAKS
ncbi:DDE-type integrase/transposase/recombinase [Rhodococcus daqingensis]|uniref:DDE-type integrase/transposase/recombinase n=1 Tax=Rhodococcus daqingensis TaxID=2479363 RepID=A0ABW2RVW6_9NOCA